MMMALAIACLVILGFMWIGEVVKRFGSDLNELRSGDWPGRIAIVAVWIVTLGIMGVMGRYALLGFQRIHLLF